MFINVDAATGHLMTLPTFTIFVGHSKLKKIFDKEPIVGELIHHKSHTSLLKV